MTKKHLYLFVILVLLTLDFAALDDITTGNEPNNDLEYVILGLSAAAYVFLGIKFLLNRKNKKIG